jgi:hypothetical protein
VAEKRDEEEAEGREEGEENEGETPSAPEKSRASESAEEEGEEASEKEDASEENEGASEKEDASEEREEAAARVADALGVGDESAEAQEEAPAEEPVRNRAARRREEALERRRKRKGSESTETSASARKPKPATDDEALPKDKNARAKELLRRRREEASGRRPVDLLPSEMVDDALSRMASSSGRWIRENFGVIQWVVVAAAVLGGGFLIYANMGEKSAMAASSALAQAVSDERGRVMPEDKRSDEEKEFDNAKVFKTADERENAALNDYNAVVDKYAGTGPAILAKLGQAGVFLEKKDYQHALDSYNAVLATPLAAADQDVKGRALEGVGFAKEGKADLDGALATFKQLEGVDMKPYKELSQYHQARILLAKGGKENADKAKELLKAAREKLQSPSTTEGGHPFAFLAAVVDDELRKIDPSAVPAKPSIGGARGNSMTPEEMEALMKRAREAAERKAKENGGN